MYYRILHDKIFGYLTKQLRMPVDFSFSNVMAGIVFGSFGLYVLKLGKQKSHAIHIVLGLTLMIYPYFVSNEWINWALGSGLLFAAYKLK